MAKAGQSKDEASEIKAGEKGLEKASGTPPPDFEFWPDNQLGLSPYAKNDPWLQPWLKDSPVPPASTNMVEPDVEMKTLPAPCIQLV